jgi:Putative beta-barrel porin-2, OmpL-like. bbp2
MAPPPASLATFREVSPMITITKRLPPSATGTSLATAALVLLLAGAAAAQSPPDPPPPAPQADKPTENPTLAFFKNTELSGFVDTYYAYNFNRPATACATVGGVDMFNCLHNFDVAHNSFSLNMAKLALEKKPTTDSRGGFRVDLTYGQSAALVGGYDSAPAAVNQTIEQAYLSYLAPAGKGTIQFDFGKFVTQHGAEVIETKDNWNYSRSLLFSLAIPYYHEGVRMLYNPNDKLTLGANITNGWNDVVDNNTGKTAGFMAILKPKPAISWTLNYMVGPEQAGENSDIRNLFDTTFSYTATPKISLMLNYDHGSDTISGSGVSWQGVAGYAKLSPNAWFSLVPRVEFLKDGDGFMTGTSQNLQEFTLTAEFKHKDGVLMRVEYRNDHASTDYFVKETDAKVANQGVFTVGWVYAFSSKTP